MKSDERTKQLVIRITPAMAAELRALAVAEDRTVSQQVRLILRRAMADRPATGVPAEDQLALPFKAADSP